MPLSTSENSSWKNWNTTLLDVTVGIKSIPSGNKPLRQNLTKYETRIDNNRTHHGSKPFQKVPIATIRKQNKNENDNHIENGDDAITYVGNTAIHDTKNMPDEKKNTNAIITNNPAIINILCNVPSRKDNNGTNTQSYRDAITTVAVDISSYQPSNKNTRASYASIVHNTVPTTIKSTKDINCFCTQGQRNKIQRPIELTPSDCMINQQIRSKRQHNKTIIDELEIWKYRNTDKSCKLHDSDNTHLKEEKRIKDQASNNMTSTPISKYHHYKKTTVDEISHSKVHPRTMNEMHKQAKQNHDINNNAPDGRDQDINMDDKVKGNCRKVQSIERHDRDKDSLLQQRSIENNQTSCTISTSTIAYNVNSDGRPSVRVPR